jgi:drug/metabolite transporter (DMT)-like permease
MPRELRYRLLLAFAAVYLVWGSTYLAIRVAIETMPPFLMAGVRFLIAGAVLYGWARLRGAPRGTWAEWRAAVIIGVLLLVGGNGGVVWAEQIVPSGLTALMVGAEPLWVVILDWMRPGGRRPGLVTGLGLAIGFLGVTLLAAPWSGGSATVPVVGTIALTIAIISWAVGSIYSRSAPQPASPLLGTGQKMLAGGAALVLLSAATGEPARFDVAAVSPRSAVALAYLIVFGAIVGFTAYLWLLQNTSLAKASTYAYVNPIVAVFLGWLMLDEPLNARILLAAAIIVTGVFLISGLQLVAKRKPRLVSSERGLRGSGATSLPAAAVPSRPAEG